MPVGSAALTARTKTSVLALVSVPGGNRFASALSNATVWPSPDIANPIEK